MRYTAIFMLGLALAACGTPHAKPSQAAAADASVLNRPQPANEAARIRECTWLRSEVIRQQQMANYAVAAVPRDKVSAYLNAIHRDLAQLEARGAKLECNVPYVATTK